MFLCPIMFLVTAGLHEAAKTLRVGVPRAHFYDDLDDEVGAAVEQALAVIRTLAAEVRDVQLDVPTDRTVQAV